MKNITTFSLALVALSGWVSPVSADQSSLLVTMPPIIASGGNATIASDFETDNYGTCASGAQTVMWEGREWQRCEDGQHYNWEEAKTYCSNLSLAGHSDWRLPTITELSSLVVCSNGVDPIVDYPDDRFYCGTNYSSPNIDAQFSCREDFYWSSSEYGVVTAWMIECSAAILELGIDASDFLVRCVR